MGVPVMRTLSFFLDEGDMSLKKLVVGAVIAMGIASLGSAAANADVTYTYMGNDFTLFTGPYTGNDFVAVSITLASALGASAPFQGVSPTAFRISDGVQSFDNNSPPVLILTFDLGTDADGIPNIWRLR